MRGTGYILFPGLVGIVCNVCLAGSKLAVGKLAGSMSITADGLNNLSDAASSIVTLTGFKLAEKPADKEHPYGHARFEYLASLTVAVMILFIGFELAKSSLEKVLHPVTVEFSLLSMIVLIASILVKAEMMIFNTRMGKRIDSTTLLATAADSRNDVLTTTAVLIAALVEHATGWKVDGIMGILVAVFILWSGIGLARDTISRFSGRCEIRLSKRTDTGDHDVSDGTWLS
ncbi:MAG: cation diffusion facilitator family transporter [Oliverpabstia sp.]